MKAGTGQTQENPEDAPGIDRITTKAAAGDLELTEMQIAAFRLKPPPKELPVLVRHWSRLAATCSGHNEMEPLSPTVNLGDTHVDGALLVGV